MADDWHARFWLYVDQNGPNGCWVWTGATVEGYGKLVANRKLQLAHRLSWKLHFGDIPEGLCVLHRCDNRCCVSPACLYVGTKKTNALDMAAKGRAPGQQKTHCPSDHEYNDRNTRVTNGRRTCDECKRIYSLAYQRRKRAELSKS